MPVIKVWCLPEMPEERLQQLFQEVVKAVDSVEVLGLKGEKSMTVLFPRDMMSYGLGTEIIVEVTGLFEKPELTNAIRNDLARNLGTAVHKLFSDALVECFVYSFQPARGFWSSR